MHSPAADLRHARRKHLQRGVDGVRPHGITHIVNQVHHQKGTDRRSVDLAHFNIPRTAAKARQRRVFFARQLKQFLLMRQNTGLCRSGVGDIQQLQLTYHLRRGCRSDKAAARAGQFRHKRSPRHY